MKICLWIKKSQNCTFCMKLVVTTEKCKVGCYVGKFQKCFIIFGKLTKEQGRFSFKLLRISYSLQHSSSGLFELNILYRYTCFMSGVHNTCHQYRSLQFFLLGFLVVLSNIHTSNVQRGTGHHKKNKPLVEQVVIYSKSLYTDNHQHYCHCYNY